MAAQIQTVDISRIIVDIPVIPEEILPPLHVQTQRASKLLKEINSEEVAKFQIGPLRLKNFLYNAAHLFLPYFYSSRAYPVLSSATWTEEEIKSKFTEAASKDIGITLKHWPDVKNSWNEFLDSLSNEWKTLNLVSALLLTAIYNVLQLGGRGNNLTQCTALMSLLSALMSLLFGCLYLIRFETMRRAYKAIQWSSDALITSRTVFWNIYILLALPSVWLAWSLILFVVCLMSIVWQPVDETIGSTGGLGSLNLATKIAVSALLAAGMAHLSLALFTFARYGSRLDKTWRKKLESFSGAIQQDAEGTNSPSRSPSFEDSRLPNADVLSSPEWHSPYTATVGRPLDNDRPPRSNLLSSSHSSSHWLSPYTATVGMPLYNSRLPHSQSLSAPYPVGRPFNNNEPPYSSHNWPYPIDRPFDNNGAPYSSHNTPYQIGRPFDNNGPPYSSYYRPHPTGRPVDNSRPLGDSGPVDHSTINDNEPVDSAGNRPFDDSDTRALSPTMAYPFIIRPPSAP